MTVVCFRDGVLASDSQAASVHGVIVGALKKVFDLGDGALACVTGYAPTAMSILDWFVGGMHGDQPKPPDEDRVGCLTVFLADGRIRLFENGGEQPEAEADFHAYGAGSEIAMGAMFMGASAVQAVEAAIALHTQCGGPVQRLEMARPEGKVRLVRRL